MSMRSKLADALRQEQIESIRRLTPAERVALALQLGRRDLLAYMNAQTIDRPQAVNRIRRLQQAGRRYSRCMDESLA